MEAKRDLLVLLRTELMSEDEIRHEISFINQLLYQAESHQVFCKAHELAERTRITQRAHRILRASRLQILRPFCFLINKN